MEHLQLGGLSVWIEKPTVKPIARLVHCHGLGEHSGRHKNTFAKLRQYGVEVFRFDHRGCGQSKGERQWIENFSDYVDDARDVLERAKKAEPSLPLFLMGHSLGGAVAMHLASERQRDLKGLILSAPAFHIGEGISKTKLMVGRWIEKVLPHLRVPGGLDLSTLSRDPQVEIDYKNDNLCCTFNTVKQANAIVRALPHMAEKARSLRIPLLIVHGGADRLIPIAGSRELVDAAPISDKTFKEFPGGFHELHNDIVKDEYTDLVAKWVKDRV